MLRSLGADGVNVLVRSASKPPGGREDVRLDAAAGGDRGGSGPPGGLRPEDCEELGRGGRRDVDAGGETGVREPHGTSSSTATVAPPDSSADRLGRDGCSGAETPDAPSSRDTKSCHHGADLTDYPRAVGTVTADTPLSGVAATGGAGTGTIFRDGWRGDRVQRAVRPALCLQVIAARAGPRHRQERGGPAAARAGLAVGHG